MAYGAKKNHPDCPAGKPHATTDASGAAVMCHVNLKDAQDLALTLNIPDATPAPGSDPGTADSPSVTPGGAVSLPAAAAAAGTPPAVPALATWPDVELVAVGEWDLSTGPASFTTADLQSAVGAADCPAVGRPILKIGHSDPRFPAEQDGEPAIGWVAGMRLNESMTKIIGDFAGMPGWLGEILPSAYPQRSVEGGWNFPCQMGHVHPFVITAVALLGATPPGVGIIASLVDVAALYGIEAAAPADPAAVRPFTFTSGDAMPQAGSTVLAAGTNTTIDDVRREFYDSAPWSQWIIELQLEPLTLIVSDDATGDLSRVPIILDAKSPGTVTFGDAETVLVQYIAAPTVKAEAAKGGPLRRVAASWPTAVTSRAGLLFVTAAWDSSAQVSNLGDDPTSTQLKAMYALPADTKSDSKLPHHVVSDDGTVGAADPDGVSAAIGAVNGARGGLAGVSAADKKAAYDHLAAHAKAAGDDPPEFKAATKKASSGTDSNGNDPDDADQAGDPPDCPTCNGSGKINNDTTTCPDCGGTGEMPGDSSTSAAAGSRLVDGQVVAGPGIAIEAGGAHGTYTGEHDHQHSSYGSQGGDETHGHMHGHTNDGVHAHAHDPVSSAPTPPAAPAAARKEGNPDMEFTAEQMAAIRTRLGKKDGEEITAADIAATFAAPQIEAGAATTPTSDGKLPPIGDGSYLVDSEVLRDWQKRAAAGDAALHKLHINERDQILAEAVNIGKFPQSKLDAYRERWDRDPEGTRELVGALAAGLVPVGTGPIGQPGFDADMPGVDFEQADAYRKLYPDDIARAGAGQQGRR